VPVGGGVAAVVGADGLGDGLAAVTTPAVSRAATPAAPRALTATAANGLMFVLTSTVDL
jgi:hypothetical protein